MTLVCTLSPSLPGVHKHALSPQGPSLDLNGTVTHLSADLLGVGAQGLQHAGGHALTLAQQAQQDVLRANVVVAW